MLPLQLHVTNYFKDRNYCEGVLPSGELVAFDPFVSRAVILADEDYEAGKGSDIVRQNFLITDFSVQPWFFQDQRYHYMIIPREGGLIAL